MKKIIGCPKDDNGIYVRSPRLPEEPSMPKFDKTTIKDVDLDNITRKHMIILHRETVRLLAESSAGLLSREAGIAFERCVKITRDLRQAEKEILESLTDVDLEKLAKEGE